jgi:hypothetical protein
VFLFGRLAARLRPDVARNNAQDQDTNLAQNDLADRVSDVLALKRLGHTSVKTTEIYCTYLTAEEERMVKFGPTPEGTKSGTAPTVLPRHKID